MVSDKVNVEPQKKMKKLIFQSKKMITMILQTNLYFVPFFPITPFNIFEHKFNKQFYKQKKN